MLDDDYCFRSWNISFNYELQTPISEEFIEISNANPDEFVVSWNKHGRHELWFWHISVLPSQNFVAV